MFIHLFIQRYFIDELMREGVDHLPRSITNEYSAKERYMKWKWNWNSC